MCGSSGRRDLCAGRRVTSVPIRDKTIGTLEVRVPLRVEKIGVATIRNTSGYRSVDLFALYFCLVELVSVASDVRLEVGEVALEAPDRFPGLQTLCELR